MSFAAAAFAKSASAERMAASSAARVSGGAEGLGWEQAARLTAKAIAAVKSDEPRVMKRFSFPAGKSGDTMPLPGGGCNRNFGAAAFALASNYANFACS